MPPRVQPAPLYGTARFLTGLICHGPLRLRVYGADRVPLDGPLIVAANHLSYVDPVALGVALPRPVRYIAKIELFRIPVLGPLITSLGAYPVDRSKGDIAAIKTSVAQLAAGNAVGIFPEGTRNLDGTAKVQMGVALLASLSGAPVLPAFIKGGDQARRLGRLSVAFGEPIHFGRKASRDDLAKWRDEVYARIRALGESIGAD